MHPIIFLPLFIGVLIFISACTAPKGSIVIRDNPNGTGLTMDFKDWSLKDRRELSLNKGDVLQIEVACESGEIDLVISGENGSEPYRGNSLKSILFTVTLSETDKYFIQITGKKATGKVTVIN
ncbi:MAG: hypothetical protein GX854_04575 [Clostridiales bacterium]|jgi:hypothetical protein|nr:hypothetical protein [Clostridiales bacterium]